MVQLRLDPTDEEAWQDVLDPQPDRLEISAGSRIMLILVTLCRDPKVALVHSSFMEAGLAGAPWPEEMIALALWGRRLRTFFDDCIPLLGSVASQCVGHLSGGWLDFETARTIHMKLVADRSALLDGFPTVARRLSAETGLSEAWHLERLQRGLDELEAGVVLSSPGDAIWTVED